jgi:molybdenum cofactor guanylyltransferase
MTTVKTIVLAGGLSRRMGRDKARIEVFGVPLLTQLCHVGLVVSDSVYVVAGFDRDYSDILPDGCEFVVDRVLEGPLTALQLTLPQVFASRSQNLGEPEWVLVLACDLPNLSGAVVRAWVEQLENVPAETIAVLPKSENGWEPLCGLYHRRSIPLLNQFAATGGRSFQRWLDQSSVRPLVRELEWIDRRVFLNCNTPIDLAAIEPVIAAPIETGES